MDVVVLQIAFPFLVRLPLLRKSVPAAIGFNRELGFQAEEVQIVRTDWMLSAEFAVEQLPVTEMAPERLFRPCGGLSEIA